MKKTLAFVAMLIMALTITACGSSKTQTDSSQGDLAGSVISTCEQKGDSYVVGGDMLFTEKPKEDPRCNTFCTRDNKTTSHIDCIEGYLLCYCN